MSWKRTLAVLSNMDERCAWDFDITNFKSKRIPRWEGKVLEGKQIQFWIQWKTWEDAILKILNVSPMIIPLNKTLNLKHKTYRNWNWNDGLLRDTLAWAWGTRHWEPFVIHSKSEKVCGFYFSVSKNLREKCINSDGKISRQKCVNHKNHKNLVSMWHFCWEYSVF